MAGLDGLKEILIASDPGSGVNPEAGYIYKWIEASGADYIYKYKTSAGVVGNIGTSGGGVQSVNSGTGISVDNSDPINPIVNLASSTFRWMLQAGHSNLPSNGTESAFSYGHNNANDGVTMLRDGNIIGMSVRVEPGANGTATYIITKNNVENNVVGQRVVVDGGVNSEGGINNTSAAFIFTTPFPYVRGDQIEVRAITSGWGNSGSDSTVLVNLEDTL